MTDLPPLNALRAFEAAGRHLNFRAAADALGVTQGAVAQQVRLLEGRLGTPLFDRGPRGLAFTPAGRGYHRRVTAAFADLREATALLRPAPDKVLVSTTPTFAARWLIPNLPDFAAAHPGIDLRIMATEHVSSFAADGVDIAIRQGPPPRGASLDTAPLFAVEIVAVCAPALLRGATPPVDADTLAALPKLHDAHDLWPGVLTALGVGMDAGRGLRLNQTTLAIDAALSGQGVALVHRFLVARELASGALIEAAALPETAAEGFHVVAPRHARRRAATDAVFRWLQSRAQGGEAGHRAAYHVAPPRRV